MDFLGWPFFEPRHLRQAIAPFANSIISGSNVSQSSHPSRFWIPFATDSFI